MKLGDPSAQELGKPAQAFIRLLVETIP